MSSATMSGAPTSSNPLKSKWVQLALGVICMMSISSPQYVWALFTKPIMGQLGVTLTELQVTFSILIVLQTFFSPFQGFLVEKFGPRLLLSIGTALTGLSCEALMVKFIFLYQSRRVFCERSHPRGET